MCVIIRPPGMLAAILCMYLIPLEEKWLDLYRSLLDPVSYLKTGA